MTKTHRNRAGNASRRNQILTFLVCALLLAGGVALGGYFAFTWLRGIWNEQCRIEDAELDVVITTGKLIDPGVITYHFGLTNGANLATIPFDALRARLLERVPNIRDIHIQRRLPNRVIIDVQERQPIARVIRKGHRGETGRVVDAENVVFRFAGETDALPVICESAAQATTPGKKLDGLAAAATRLIRAAADPEFTDLRVLEIDATPVDHLVLSLGNTDRAKFAWEHMLEDTAASQEKLRRQLRHLLQAISARLTPPATLWNAKDWQTNRIFADPNRNGAEKGALP